MNLSTVHQSFLNLLDDDNDDDVKSFSVIVKRGKTANRAPASDVADSD